MFGYSLTGRTAVYGPVCTVVWEGWSREASPYPDSYRTTGPRRHPSPLRAGLAGGLLQTPASCGPASTDPAPSGPGSFPALLPEESCSLQPAPLTLPHKPHCPINAPLRFPHYNRFPRISASAQCEKKPSATAGIMWQSTHTLTGRTAVCGPVCTVAWEGWSREAAPYPDCAEHVR